MNIITRRLLVKFLKSSTFSVHTPEGWTEHEYDTRPYLAYPGTLGVLAPVEYEDENTATVHPAGDCLRFLDAAPRGATLRFPQYSYGGSYWFEEEDVCYQKGRDGRWYKLN